MYIDTTQLSNPKLHLLILKEREISYIPMRADLQAFVGAVPISLGVDRF